MSDGLDFRPTGVEWKGEGHGLVQFGTDRQMVCNFYIKSVENPAKSLAAGSRIFENHVYVKMHAAGERLNIIDRPVKDEDKRRFPEQWRNFLANKAQVPEGTPVDLLFPNFPAVADSMRANGVYTIQQLAALSDEAISTLGIGGQEYVNKAKQYLLSASDGTRFLEYDKVIRDLKQENKILTQKLDEALIKINDLIKMQQNPDKASLQPPFIPNYDVQSERINANHATKLISEAEKNKKLASPVIAGLNDDPFSME